MEAIYTPMYTVIRVNIETIMSVYVQMLRLLITLFEIHIE